MRLTEVEVRQGILHPDDHVRFAAVQYFAESFSRNTTVMPVVIEAMQRWAPGQALIYEYPISHLVQTEETIAWVLEQLQRPSKHDEADDNHLYHLSRILCHADSRLLVPREEAILESPGFDRRLADAFSDRLRRFVMDADSLWRELEAICDQAKDKSYVHDVRYSEGERIAEALACDASQADRMMSLLKQQITNYEDNPLTWMEIFMVYMAGEMRYEPAVPLIVSKLHDEGEILSEECGHALVKIGTDAVVQSVREAYPNAEDHFRLYASEVFGRIHSEQAVTAGLELLRTEPDYDLQLWLAQALLEQFCSEANDAARQLLVNDSYLLDLRRSLVTACTLMQQEFPELDQWRAELEDEFSRKPHGKLFSTPAPKARRETFARLDGPALEPPHSHKTIGRNDPCPCGSGKKFKRCCLNKKAPR